MSDTPRTDSRLTAILDADGFVDQSNCPQRWVNHGRELERELNAANERIKQLEDNRTVAAANSFANMLAYEDAIAKIKRLEEALRRIANQDYRGNRSTESQIAAEALKEAKP
jgi:hypothetical protein